MLKSLIVYRKTLLQIVVFGCALCIQRFTSLLEDTITKIV
jgi:hypothetical protein